MEIKVIITKKTLEKVASELRQSWLTDTPPQNETHSITGWADYRLLLA